MIRRRFRLVLLVLLVVVVVLAVSAVPARAIGSFGPPVGVYDPPCPFDGFSVDAAQDTSGVAHGFAQLWCEDDLTIHYFEGSGGTWTQEATPHQGFVMGVAWDTTGTYLLYFTTNQRLRIKRGSTEAIALARDSDGPAPGSEVTVRLEPAYCTVVPVR